MKLEVEINEASMDHLIVRIQNAVENSVSKILNSPEEKKPESFSENEEELLTRKEVMKMLNISHATLYHYQRKCILPFIKIGNRVYFKKTDILENSELEGKWWKYKSGLGD